MRITRKSTVFHALLAVVPSVVSEFVPFVVTSPIDANVRAKLGSAAIGFSISFAVIFLLLRSYHPWRET
jgi:hypothetical protein